MKLEGERRGASGRSEFLPGIPYQFGVTSRMYLTYLVYRMYRMYRKYRKVALLYYVALGLVLYLKLFMHDTLYPPRFFFYAWMLEQSKNLRLNENEMVCYISCITHMRVGTSEKPM